MAAEQLLHPVVCFSSIDWDFIWQGHQEIMVALAARGHQVLFVENTGVRNPALRDLPRIRKRLAAWRRSVAGFRRERKNLYIFSPVILPFPYARLARRINSWLMVSALRRWLRIMEMERPICWTFLPTPLTLDVIHRIPRAALIYYCIDSFVDSTPAAGRIVRSEEALLGEADLVFVTSRQLQERAMRFSRAVHWFPFGVTQRALADGSDDESGAPKDLRGLRRPIVGYVGGIHQWVDQELLCRTARAMPHCSFALIGPVQTDVERLQREPNIRLFGQRAHDELLRYIAHFDVGLIPYRLTDYTRNVYPTKLNEYHGKGKPVVSTPLPEVLRFNETHNGLVGVGDSEEAFRGAIERALREDGAPLRQQRVEAARENSWDRRIVEMEALIEQVLAGRRVMPPENWAARLAASLQLPRAVRRVALWLVLAAVLMFWTPVPWLLARPLMLQQAPRPADAIVVFAGGVGESGQAGEGYRARLRQGLDLFSAAYAPRLLLVSGYTQTFQEADIMQTLSQALGVPATAIQTERQVRNTRDYVVRVGERARRQGWRRVLLVTSPYHGRRAALTFARLAPELEVIHVPAHSSYYVHGWGIRMHQLRGLLHECAGLLYYRWKGWL